MTSKYIAEVIINNNYTNQITFSNKKTSITLTINNINFTYESNNLNFKIDKNLRVLFEDDTIILYYFNTIIKIIFDKNSSSSFKDLRDRLTEYMNLSKIKLYDENKKLSYYGYVIDDKIPHIDGEYYYPSGYVKYKGNIEYDNFDGKGMFISSDGKGILEVNNISNGIIIGSGSLVYKDKKIIINFDEYYVKKNLVDKKDKINFTKDNKFMDIILKDYQIIKEEEKQEGKLELKEIDKKLESIYQLIIMTTIVNLILHLII